jgi:hypothetical protein
MRLAESKIKEALLHPERLARQEALHYFSKGHTQDQEVMPLAIQAIQTYGQKDAFFFGHPVADLPQTPATIDWAIQQLNGPDAKQTEDEFHLSRLLCQADPRFLLPRQDDTLSARGFAKDAVANFHERLRLLSWDADQCWQELETISQQHKSEHDVGKVGMVHARHVVEALARQGGKYTDQILTLLSQKIDTYVNNPMTWMEIFLVMLAGEMRLQPAIPLLVAKLRNFDEFLAENCVTALEKIGTDQAALALTDGFLKQSWDYRLYASGALEHIHADATVSQCLALLPQEQELDIKTNLAVAAVASFAVEGVEPVRALIQKDQYDPRMEDLPGRLAAACTIMEVDFPERDSWKQKSQEKQAKFARNIRALAMPNLPALRAAIMRNHLDAFFHDVALGRGVARGSKWRFAVEGTKPRGQQGQGTLSRGVTDFHGQVDGDAVAFAQEFAEFGQESMNFGIGQVLVGKVSQRVQVRVERLECFGVHWPLLRSEWFSSSSATFRRLMEVEKQIDQAEAALNGDSDWGRSEAVRKVIREIRCTFVHKPTNARNQPHDDLVKMEFVPMSPQAAKWDTADIPNAWDMVSVATSLTFHKADLQNILGHDILTIGEVCQMFGVTYGTVHYWERSSRIKSIRKGKTGHRKYRRADVRKLMGD